MSRVFVTGDCHANWNKFAVNHFPVQKELTKDDIMIVCGDFGIWADTPQERHDLDWLSDKNFTTVFVDGNHENFDRLYSEFPIVEFRGAKAHQIRPSIYHIMRGEIMTIDDKKFFCFGGASSHDIDDGILDPATFVSKDAFKRVYKAWDKAKKMFRVKGISWWPQELPTEEELAHGLENLIANDGEVDYIISHCAPQELYTFLGFTDGDVLTNYFDTIAHNVMFNKWYSGHVHINQNYWGKFVILYEKIDEIRMED